MLIYNHDKEFLGIDESDLKALSISNLTELQSQAAESESQKQTRRETIPFL